MLSALGVSSTVLGAARATSGSSTNAAAMAMETPSRVSLRLLSYVSIVRVSNSKSSNEHASTGYVKPSQIDTDQRFRQQQGAEHDGLPPSPCMCPDRGKTSRVFFLRGGTKVRPRGVDRVTCGVCDLAHGGCDRRESMASARGMTTLCGKARWSPPNMASARSAGNISATSFP